MTEQFTPHIGEKFHTDTSARSFPGNTIIAFVDPARDSAVYQAALWAQEQLQAMDCARKFVFLPPDSFHMTVMDLVCDQVRQADRWSRLMPLDASLAEMDEFFIAKVATVEPPKNLRMSFVRVRTGGIVLAVEPADDATEKAIWNYRERIAEVTGVRFPDFDSYGFHISLAYNLIYLNEAEVQERDAAFARIGERLRKTFGVFEPAPPQLTFFEDMVAFVPEEERHTLPARS